MIKHTLSAVSVAALMLSPAFAQSAPPKSADPARPAQMSPSQPATTAPSTASPTQFLNRQAMSEWRGSVLIGTSVIGADNKSIGEINDLVLDQNGATKAVVVGVGGFLGIGEKNVAIPFNALSITRKANDDDIEKITVSYTKEQLEKAPSYAFLGDSDNKAAGSAPAQTTGAANRDAMPADKAPATPPAQQR